MSYSFGFLWIMAQSRSLSLYFSNNVPFRSCFFNQKYGENETMARLNCHLGKEIDFHPKIPRKRKKELLDLQLWVQKWLQRKIPRKRELVRFPFFLWREKWLQRKFPRKWKISQIKGKGRRKGMSWCYSRCSRMAFVQSDAVRKVTALVTGAW